MYNFNLRKMALLQKGHTYVLVKSGNDTTGHVQFSCRRKSNAFIFLEQLAIQQLAQGSYSVMH